MHYIHTSHAYHHANELAMWQYRVMGRGVRLAVPGTRVLSIGGYCFARPHNVGMFVVCGSVQ